MPIWSLPNGHHIGHILKPHSYLGKVKVAFLFSGLDEWIAEDDWLFPIIGGRPVPLQIENIQWPGDNYALIKFRRIDSDTDVAAIIGLELWMTADEQTWNDIQHEEGEVKITGFAIVDKHLGHVGTVTDIIAGSAQDILVGVRNGVEILIPYHEDIVTSIDQKNQTVHTNLPEGLIS